MKDKKQRNMSMIFIYKNIKAFTLIELLAVIVILAIIAVIATPIILGVINDSKYKAFKLSLNNIEHAYELYAAQNNIEQGTEIDISKLPLDSKNLKGKVFLNIDGKVELKEVTDGTYSAEGTLDDLSMLKGTVEDLLANRLAVEENIISTSNSIIITLETIDGVPTSYSYQIIEPEEEKKEINDIKENTYTFDKLKFDTEYKIKIIVKNKANLAKEITKLIKTEKIEQPTIAITDDSSNNQQIAKIVYTGDGINNPQYFVYTTKSGVSSSAALKCTKVGTDTLGKPGECTNSTTNLDAKTWYKVDGNVDITYTKDDTIGYIYAVVYDGVNFGKTTSYILNNLGYNSKGLLTLFDGFNKPVNNTWKDLSNNGNNGNLINFSGGVENDGITFDGVDDYILVNKATEFPSGDSQYTMEIVIYYPELKNRNNLISMGGMEAHIANGMYILNSTGVSHWYWADDLRVEDALSAPNSYTITGLFNGTNRELYINGLLVAHDNSIPSVEPSDVTIGKEIPKQGGFFKGKVMSVRIYNRGLTSQEVYKNFSIDKSRFNINS